MNELTLKWEPRGKLWGLPCVYLMVAVSFMGHFIPVGTRTDGASLPFFLRPFLSPFGDYFPAALLHDYLLKHEKDWTRQECAHAFKRALKHLGMPSWLTNGFYWGVRAWDHWIEFKHRWQKR